MAADRSVTNQGCLDQSAATQINDALQTASGNAPASATAAGKAGDIAFDSTHVYVCVAANTWKRATISSF